MKIKKILKQKGGMTLIEVVVAMLLFTIITTAVTSILAPTLTAYSNANDLAEVTSLSNDIAAVILDSLEQSTVNAKPIPSAADPAIFDGIEIKIDSKIIEYAVVNGVLQSTVTTNEAGTTPVVAAVFDEKYYKRKKVAITYEVTYGNPAASEKPTYVITVQVLNRADSLIFQSIFTCKPLLLNQ